MNGSDSITVDGIDRVFVNIGKVSDDVAKQAKSGLRKAGFSVIASAQRNLRTAGHNGGTLNNTGRLSQSGRVQDVKNEDGALDVGFFSDEGGRGYAAAVEYGTRAHVAPLDPIRQWVKKKLRVAEKSINTVAFFVHRKIRTKGTPPHAFFGPAVEKHKEEIVKSISDAVASATNKNHS